MNWNPVPLRHTSQGRPWLPWEGGERAVSGPQWLLYGCRGCIINSTHQGMSEWELHSQGWKD